VGRTQRRYQTDLATFGTYLKARELSDARRSRQAITEFAKVTEADPSYAPAKAALAAAYGDLASHYPLPNNASILPSDAVAVMAPLVKEALEADPTLPEAYAARGYLHAFARRWKEAETSFRQAIDLDPTNTGLKGDFVSSVLLPWGRLDEALEVMRTALSADPLSLDARRVLSLVQLADGLYSEAWDNCQQVLARDPNFPFADHFCTWARLFKGEQAEALAEFEEFSQNGTRLGVVGWIHAINDRRGAAEAIAAGLDHLPQRQAEIYGLLGDTDRVLEALERLAVSNPIRAGFELVHPAVGLKRDDPRVKDFRRRLGFPN
jgi:tetratricopeptide (TPR) repeat protein